MLRPFFIGLIVTPFGIPSKEVDLSMGFLRGVPG
jgi:hypothetical protein